MSCQHLKRGPSHQNQGFQFPLAHWEMWQHQATDTCQQPFGAEAPTRLPHHLGSLAPGSAVCRWLETGKGVQMWT